MCKNMPITLLDLVLGIRLQAFEIDIIAMRRWHPIQCIGPQWLLHIRRWESRSYSSPHISLKRIELSSIGLKLTDNEGFYIWLASWNLLITFSIECWPQVKILRSNTKPSRPSNQTEWDKRSAASILPLKSVCKKMFYDAPFVMDIGCATAALPHRTCHLLSAWASSCARNIW